MCGIVGFKATPDLTESDLIERMAATLAHRGPDGDGFYRDNVVALGQRRLSIIDLAGGWQPMSDSDQTVWVLNNGEIYNYRELRIELESLGCRFRTDSDTEAIVQGYLAWGEGVVERLRGMFALAIWDTRAQRLLLARDRVGKKPLYYHHGPSGLFFASEIKALLPIPELSRQLDSQAIADYFTYLWIPEPLTIYESVKKLPPGHLLILEASGQVSIQRYWRWKMLESAKSSLSYEDAVQEIRRQVEEAVRVRLMSDVPLGALLSGGIDSSAVVAFMARNSDQPVKTFTIGFDVGDYDERPYAREIAELFRTEHHELIVRPESLDDVLPKLARQYDEPFADASMLPTYYVTKLAREHVTVALGGDGGDEVFAGYERYRKLLAWSQVADLMPDALRCAMLRPIENTLPTGQFGKRPLQLFSRNRARRYQVMLRRFQPRELAALLQPDYPAARSVMGDWMESWGDVPYLRQMQQADMEFYLPAGILVKVDRASMLNSLEMRAPLLDHHLLDFVATLPHEWQLRDGPKTLLKAALRGIVPENILTRKKSGFRVPLDAWFKGDFQGYLRDMLLSNDSQSRAFFQRGAVESLIEQQASGWGRLTDVLWALLMFELWYKEYRI